MFERFPFGWSVVRYAGKRYGVTRTQAVRGRAEAIYAEELGGNDVISANLYLTGHGEQLRPCEMPEQKVRDFLERAEP